MLRTYSVECTHPGTSERVRRHYEAPNAEAAWKLAERDGFIVQRVDVGPPRQQNAARPATPPQPHRSQSDVLLRILAARSPEHLAAYRLIREAVAWGIVRGIIYWNVVVLLLAGLLGLLGTLIILVAKFVQ